MQQNPSIVNLNLNTKSKRRMTKGELIETEMARLERANSYIKNDPSKVAYAQRNSARIDVLRHKLKALQIDNE